MSVATRGRRDDRPGPADGVRSVAANPSGRLAAFQDAFAAALMAPGVPGDGAGDGAADTALDAAPEVTPEVTRLVAQPGFAVYRNTVLKGCIDALQANYPAVSRLVGDEWFRAAAGIHARASLPRRPSLLDYGSGFPAFLAAFGPAAELPYLAGVARLDRFWTEAHLALDEDPLAATAVARLGAAALGRTVLHLHAAARWAWFDDAPVVTIWERNRGGTSIANDVASLAPDPASESIADERERLAPDLEWRAEGVLITRPEGKVEWTALPRAGCAFLDACAAGATLAVAAAAALDADREADLAALMALLLDAGAFGSLAVGDGNPEEPGR